MSNSMSAKGLTPRVSRVRLLFGPNHSPLNTKEPIAAGSTFPFAVARMSYLTAPKGRFPSGLAPVPAARSNWSFQCLFFTLIWLAPTFAPILGNHPNANWITSAPVSLTNFGQAHCRKRKRFLGDATTIGFLAKLERHVPSQGHQLPRPLSGGGGGGAVSNGEVPSPKFLNLHRSGITTTRTNTAMWHEKLERGLTERWQRLPEVPRL